MQDEPSNEERAKQLVELERAKSRFFANISHEFRTPLTLILGPVENLLERSEDDFTTDQLKIVRRNSKRLLQLIDQLLELSKLENERVEIQAQKTDYGKFCAHVIESFKPLADYKNLKLEYHQESSPVGVMDRDKIEKALFNLLSNAFKFTPAEGTVSLTLYDDGDNALVKVKDSGTGVPPDDLPHLFDRFYQGEDGQRLRGTGIGLALTQEFVELHNGSISVESEEGIGSTFHISLPLEQPEWSTEVHTSHYASKLLELEEEDVSDRIPNPQLNLEDNQEKPLLLLVEDDNELRRYSRSILEAEYTMIEAINGEEGVKLAMNYIPDLIITDVMMPKKSGTELCQELKAEPLTSHIPIIMLTAKSSQEAKISGLEHGADDYLLKPFNAQEVLLKSKNVLRLRDSIIKREKGDVRPSINDQLLTQFFDFLDQDYANPDLGVNDICDHLGVSRSQLHRKLTALTGESVNKWIRTIRIGRAKKLLEDQDLQISEVCYETGFNNPSYFSKCFQEDVGILPAEFQKSLA